MHLFKLIYINFSLLKKVLYKLYKDKKLFLFDIFSFIILKKVILPSKINFSLSIKFIFILSIVSLIASGSGTS